MNNNGMYRSPPEIIAEIGVNYYDIASKLNISPLEAAKKTISEAKKAGIKAVKFQTYKAEKLAALHSPAYWDLKEEPTESQRELFSKYDKLTDDDYKSISNFCDENAIEFMSTPFDCENAIKLNTMVRRFKIASADITNIELISLIGTFQKPVVLSTGAATKEEIKFALALLLKKGVKDITLLHCVLNYPTAIEDANLWKIVQLKNDFRNVKVGYSDHTKFNLDILLTAWLLGANVIEKHFTLDKTLKGNDHYHAAEPEDLRLLNSHIHFIVTALGSYKNNWNNPKEENSRRNARRGVYLERDVKKGQPLQKDDVIFLRPLGDGISPKEWFDSLSKKNVYKKDKKTDQQIFLDDILSL